MLNILTFFTTLLFFPNLALSEVSEETALNSSIQIAQSGSQSDRCPISMPKIKSAVVFQSVEAPQIEPMSKQAHPPYNNYDLVMGKPAGVLIQLDTKTMDTKKEFAMDLFVAGDSKYLDKCFHEPFAGDMKDGQQDFCFFTKNDLRFEGNYKFFPLPMNEELLNLEKENLSITATLYPRGYSEDQRCLKEKTFRISIIYTGGLKLGFTRIDGGKNCYASRDINTGYSPVSFNIVRNFVNSTEVKSYICQPPPFDFINCNI